MVIGALYSENSVAKLTLGPLQCKGNETYTTSIKFPI